MMNEKEAREYLKNCMRYREIVTGANTRKISKLINFKTGETLNGESQDFPYALRKMISYCESNADSTIYPIDICDTWGNVNGWGDSSWRCGKEWYRFDISVSNDFRKMNLELWNKYLSDRHSSTLEGTKLKKDFAINAIKEGVKTFGKDNTDFIIGYYNITVLKYLCDLNKYFKNECIEEQNKLENKISYALKYNSWKHFYNVLGVSFPVARTMPQTRQGLELWAELRSHGAL